MRTKTILAALVAACLLSACASTELQAPPAPCASAARDCGPAQPLNALVAQAASRGPGGLPA